MTDTTLPFPFRFPEPGEDTTHAGLCQECLLAPIVQTPCPHQVVIPMASVVPAMLGPAAPAMPEEGEGSHVARPASQEPSMKGECEVCGLWAVEHEDKEVGHKFNQNYRKGYIEGAKR